MGDRCIARYSPLLQAIAVVREATPPAEVDPAGIDWIEAGAPWERDRALREAGWQRVEQWLDDDAAGIGVAEVRRIGTPMLPMPSSRTVGVGDLVAGTDVDRRISTVGVVTRIVPYLAGTGMGGDRYRVRCGALDATTGEPIERVIYDHPLIMVAAGRPVQCGHCKAGEHPSAWQYIDCLAVAQTSGLGASLAVGRADIGRPRDPLPSERIAVGCDHIWRADGQGGEHCERCGERE